jgi:hypothetical protein
LRTTALVVLGWLPSLALAQSAATPTPTPTEAIDRKPYEIRVHFAFDADSRVDAHRREAILDDWFRMVDHFVGAPWNVEILDQVPAIATLPIDELTTATLKPLAGKADKVWSIRVSAAGAGFRLEGRELDVATGWLGQTHRVEVTHPDDLVRGLFKLALAIFAPSADIGEQKAGGVSFLVQGASLPAASPVGAVVEVGTVFRALRVFEKDDGSTLEVRGIPYSYFRVESLDGPVARCEIIKGIGDPLTNRVARRNKLVALGIKPAAAVTRLRFVNRADKLPAAGYMLMARPVTPDARAVLVGTTDREGRVVLPPNFAGGLVRLRLMASSEEPLADLPVMPGESPEERTIPIEPRPHTVALEARLDALRDAIVDLAVLRGRLEQRMKARFDGEDWAGLEAATKEFRKLPARERFEETLNQIREEGERQEKELKTIVLTKNARNLLDGVKAIIDRYLDDDAIRSYEDAVEQSKAEVARAEAAKSKAKTARKATLPRPSTPPPG